ncbi:hypothetical protein K488DRAFT_42300 [Vararia minispora EC-137]|uniref:Uncharacterized protein n=1 Tax=Vararia minispora EC-137 TaxID=1314806 RepID=A0ACB8QVN1_9AGAM|nr:hypothetical protein K488DRAFT_42300 [Vararia minispora EC-137]
MSGSNSWDLFAGARRAARFDSANASQAHLAFADGDIPKTPLVRFYNYLLNVSIVTRWFLFIVPPACLLWVPGILGLTKFPDATIWSVKLVWWSVWLSVAWVGWWGSLAFSMLLPVFVRATLGVVAVGLRQYIEWLTALKRYISLFGWTLAIWVSFQPVINAHKSADASSSSRTALSFISRLLFGLYICAAVLLFEKFSVQWIATKFHEDSYSERISHQKFAVNVLTTLYRFSHDIPGRMDTLKDGPAGKITTDPRRIVKRALKGVRSVAKTTTTVFGNVASEIAGSSILQPNSPQAMVQTALESTNKTRLLARRLFYSFVQPNADVLYVTDIYHLFGNQMDADLAFTLFDKDGNGDVSRDEMEIACLELHREQLSLERSIADIDSAVGRLDNILMSLWVLIAILIIAVTLEAQLATLVTAAGTFILGLSWLIGGSLSEVLTSIIFLFIKHPFDVGDRVDLTTGSYTVKQIDLLSTIFLDSNGTLVQAPNTQLSTMMSEPFVFDVAFDTTFEQIEELRKKMLEFVSANGRDYQPTFDIVVSDIPAQEKMTLSTSIMYKSNWQQGAIKSRRRNKWICAMKQYLAECEIYGPSGKPDPESKGPQEYTLVPWDEVKHKKDALAMPMPSPTMPSGGWQLSGDGSAEFSACCPTSRFLSG